MDTPAHGPNGSIGEQAARECAAIASDLERLRALIGDAGGRLLASFDRIHALLSAAASSRGDALGAAIRSAVTALQFEDMATQLIQHAQRRLEVLEGCLQSLSHDVDPLLAVTPMQPVRQSAMGAGSIDLF